MASGPAITLILGGARSGKSSFAERMARDFGRVTYVATSDSRDAEMEARIKRHRDRRPGDWRTWEGDIADLPEEMRRMDGTLLLDCLTMYLSRLFLASPWSETEDEEAWMAEERRILALVEDIFSGYEPRDADRGSRRLIAVSNEVGFGLVPPYLMGRRFRDIQGRANQIAASRADDVALIVAGLPLWLKRGGAECSPGGERFGAV
jgi:adenosylcobinamide kinase/adenosylcobinamide-phosphate guanylyltransferase